MRIPSLFWRRVLSFILAIVLVLGLFPNFLWLPASAADDLENSNAFDAIGIDTATPENVDLNSTDNPYGRDKVDVLPVYELFEGMVDPGDSKQDATLFGHNASMLASQDSFYQNQGAAKNSGSALTAGGYSNYSAVSGDFTGSDQEDMIVTVAAGNWDKASADETVAKGAFAGVYLYITDPSTGATGTVKTLLNTDSFIGNIGRYDEEDFGDASYQLQNYLQVETGDFDGDGIDEIAVYVPQGGGGAVTSNSRVEVYKLEYTSDAGNTPQDNYLNASKWKKAWTYFFLEGYYVSNMVSLLSGDFNRDGTDDLAMSWGVYYSSEYKNTSKAVILYGDNKNEMLQRDKWFDLSYGNSQIVRAAFTYGDVNGDNTDEVILGGQSEDDINNGKMYTRLINMYTYNGDSDSFALYSSDNFSLIDYEDDEGVLQPLGDGQYYSSPAMISNIAAVCFGGRGTDHYIYLDSVLYAYGNDGLEIYDMLEDPSDGGALSVFYNDDRLDGIAHTTPAQLEMARYYVEYGALSGDFTGDSKEALQVSQYYLMQEFSTTWTESSWLKIFKRFWWFRWCPWWRLDTVKFADHVVAGKMNVWAFSAVTDAAGTILSIAARKQYDGGSTLNKYYCKLNTDNDTSFMSYTGNHYVVYTDPKVLAVIASAPYFEDVANMPGGDDHVGNSDTSYSSTTGSEQGSSSSNTISAGAYFGIDADVTVFGVKVASFEMETEYSHGWTWATEKASSLEQTITYGTAAGEDAVAFYSIPMEVYEYTLSTPVTNESNVVTGYTDQTMTVNIPHTAAVSVLSLDKYESIAADYPELPQISGVALKHTIGDPSTYPASANGYRDALAYSGNWAAVGYGNGYIAQEIAMSSSTTKSYEQTNSFSFKIGGGAGVVKAGVTVGTEWGRGSATTTTEGSTFAATLVNMPAAAEDYGYYYAWKLFTYEYSDGNSEFPVVNFMVTDVTAPPKVPTDFDWDMEQTTDLSIDLTWSYAGNASKFAIYREYNFSGNTGMVKIAEVASSETEGYDADTNARLYRYTVNGLSAYQDYNFQIQVVGTAQPATSAPGVVLNTRTKTDSGYPELTLSTGELLVYPDAVGTVGLDVRYDGQDGDDAYRAILYQWQKWNNGQWTNVANTSDFTSSTMYIRNAGMATMGDYRCMVNVIYYDDERGQEYYITAYSDTVEVSYAKRTSFVQGAITAESAGDVSRPTLSVVIENAHGDSAATPGGAVTFFVEGVDYTKSYEAELIPVSGERYSTATISSANVTELPEGIYEITAYYGGSRIFRSCESDTIMYKSGNVDGYWMELSENAVYGDTITPALYLVTGLGADATRTPVTESVSFAVDGTVGWTDGSAIQAKAVGSYTVTASVEGSAVTSKQILVSPFKLTLAAPSYTQTSNTASVGHPSVDTLTAYAGEDPELSAPINLPNNDTLAALGIYVKATNSAFKEGTMLRHDPDSGVAPAGDPTHGELWFYSPGKYTLAGTPGAAADAEKLNNYEITYLTGTYILTAETYPAVPIALLLNGQARGTVEVVSPADYTAGTEYQNGTQVTFKATPLAGYEVKAWYIANTAADVLSAVPHEVAGGIYTGTYLNYTMSSEALYVAVEFRVAQRSLTFAPNNAAYGSVTCNSSPYMTSGAIFSSGTTYTFTAAPQTGYHFVNWVVSGGASYTDTTSPTIAVTGGNTSITLRAVFERDSYQLTLNGDLQGYYFDDTDDNISTPEVKIVVESGSLIPGDKSVTVLPKSGYSVESWTNVASETQSYTFAITGNTEITAVTFYNGYAVSLSIIQASNGDSEVTCDKDIAGNIVGGTAIVFEAKPAYGTKFAGWKVNGSADYFAASDEALILSANGRSLTIRATGRDYAIEAVFVNNDAYTLRITKAAHGAMAVTITNPVFGTVDHPSYTYDGAAVSEDLTVYQGDTVRFETTAESGFQVIYWKENGRTTQTSVSDWTVANITAETSVEVDFSSMGFYTVTYGTTGDGTFSATKVDGVDFESGNQSLGAGRMISFTASPGPGNMIDHWESNGTTVLNSYGVPSVNLEYAFVLGRNTNVTAVFAPRETYGITSAGDHAAVKVIEAAPMDYASGDPDSGYTAVRKGAYAKMTVTPESGYYINSVTVAGSGDSFDQLTKEDWTPGGATGESWTGEIYAVTEDTIITVDARPIYEINFAPENGRILAGVEHIPPYDGQADAQEFAEDGRFFVREGTQLDLTFTPGDGFVLTDVTDASGSITGRIGFSHDAYTANTGTGESWQLTIDSVQSANAFTLSTAAPYAMTIRGTGINSTLTLNGPYAWWSESDPITQGSTRLVRSGATGILAITPNNRYTIDDVTVTGSADYSITQEVIDPNNPNVKRWTLTIRDISADIAIEVETQYQAPSGGGSIAPPAPPAPEPRGNIISPKVTENNGAAAVEVSEKDAEDSIQAAIDNKDDQIVVSVGDSLAVSSVAARMPASLIEQIADNTKAGLVMESGIASLSIPNQALKEIAGQATGEDVTLSVEKIDKEALTAEQAAAVGDSPVYDFNMMSGGLRISTFGGESLTVTLPYTPANPDHISVYFIADDGSLVKVEATYDPKAGTVVFATDHFSYYMITENEALGWENPYLDVASQDWYYNNVFYVHANGLMTGTEKDRFSPHNATNRAMVVTILHRLENQPEAVAAQFKDVAADQYFEKAVSWAVAAGVATGYGDRQFGPFDNVTREQLVAMLYRYSLYKEYNLSADGSITRFTDAAKVSLWATDAVKWAVGAGLLSGKENNILDPKNTATRAEVAAIFQRLLLNVVQ